MAPSSCMSCPDHQSAIYVSVATAAQVGYDNFYIKLTKYIYSFLFNPKPLLSRPVCKGGGLGGGGGGGCL